MSHVIIRAEGLGKKYLIGHEAEGESYSTLRDSMKRNVSRLKRSAVDLMRGRPLVLGDKVEEFWALRDVNFEIRSGEVVGIIGRNGAGKSTLLKVLSRITEPTEGRVTIEGRIASLLEVGTGFHPELSGRENIYLNGSILGMTRKEIKTKFDEIVDFAGVEKFIDTPVKRYSSGMKVRLGFSVAAHLEPEILIVDEVLAVGDAEFQSKCLGKMQDVAGNGRTVIFVSHNMTAVQSLCDRGYLLQGGKNIASGEISSLIKRYLHTGNSGVFKSGRIGDLSRKGEGKLRFEKLKFSQAGSGDSLAVPITGEPCEIALSLSGEQGLRGTARIGITFKDALGKPLFILANEAANSMPLQVSSQTDIRCQVNKFPLTQGRYSIDLFLEIDGVIQDWLQDGIHIDVETGSFFGTPRNCPNGWEGEGVLVEHSWRIEHRNNDKKGSV